MTRGIEWLGNVVNWAALPCFLIFMWYAGFK